MARRTLLVDCYLDGPGAAPNFLPSLAERDVHVVRAIREPMPPDPADYEAVIVSGSAASVIHDPPAWVPGLEAFVAQTVRRGVPFLGVCFGHQVLASALHGREAVFSRARMEIGWVDIELDDDPMHAGFGGSLRSFVTHFDEVRPDLPGTTVTARSRACPVHAMRLDRGLAWSVQYHPEMLREEAIPLVRRKAELAPHHIPDPDAVIALAPEADDDGKVRRLLANFYAAL